MAAMKLFIAAIFIFVLFAVSAFSQTEISPEKKELIHQFASLTQMNEVNFNATFSADGLKEKFSEMIDNDTALTGPQKVELKKMASEAVARIGSKWKAQFEGDPVFQQMGIETAYEVYGKAFTDAELKELIAFYGSPLGKKTVAFLGSVKNEIEKTYVEKTRPKMESVVGPLIDAETDALSKMIRDAEKAGK